ncbi:MAG: pseudouridylate synthase [Bacteroidetes bacterium]|nr:pseudouridylate synthase [Bacteroidota bacterium]
MLEIIFQDSHLIAINKPHGLLVHKSPIAADATEFAVQQLRNQIGAKVFPAHRLDRKTSGVLLFTLSPTVNSLMQVQFAEHKVEKTYTAIVRGFTPEDGLIDYPLKNENGVEQEALTRFETLAHAELPVPFGQHPTSRYSLLKLVPQTGRHHQLRKHLAHILHPIIGDRPHGCNKQNKLWKEKWEMTTMLLHAVSLEFEHPVSGEKIKIEAGYHAEFQRVLAIFGANLV